jgi:hypothetical protein
MTRFKMNDNDFENEFIDSNYDNYHRELVDEFWSNERDKMAEEYRKTKPHLIAHIKQELERLENDPDFSYFDTPEKRAELVQKTIKEEMKLILSFNFNIDICNE